MRRLKNKIGGGTQTHDILSGGMRSTAEQKLHGASSKTYFVKVEASFSGSEQPNRLLPRSPDDLVPRWPATPSPDSGDVPETWPEKRERA